MHRLPWGQWRRLDAGSGAEWKEMVVERRQLCRDQENDYPWRCEPEAISQPNAAYGRRKPHARTGFRAGSLRVGLEPLGRERQVGCGNARWLHKNSRQAETWRQLRRGKLSSARGSKPASSSPDRQGLWLRLKCLRPDVQRGLLSIQPMRKSGVGRSREPIFSCEACIAKPSRDNNDPFNAVAQTHGPLPPRRSTTQ